MAGNIRGMIWMTLCALSFAIANSAIRYAADEMHPLEMVFWRNLFGILVVIPLIWRVGLAHLKTERLGLHAVRGALQAGSQGFWFVAVTLIPMADVFALGFTGPIFASLGAIILLREPSRMGRWLAIACGLLGAMFIVRPGFSEISLGAVLALSSAVIFGCAKIANKSLSSTESSTRVIVYVTLITTPLSLIPALFVWTWPSMSGYAWALLISFFMTIGLWLMSQAYREGDLSAVEPFSYTILVFAAISGYFVFGEMPVQWSWIGAAIIALGGIVLVRTEVRRQETTVVN